MRHGARWITLLLLTVLFGFAASAEETPPPAGDAAEKPAVANEKDKEKKDTEGKNKDEKEKKSAERKKEVVVTAARMPTAREETGVSIDVITGNDVETNQDHLASETLRMVPGLVVNQAGRKGAFTSLITRGGESDQTLILFDGWKVNRQGGFFSWESLDPIALDRIEVARGPSSSLYGTDAVTGTVNVITAAGEGRPSLTASGAGGTYGTDRETLNTQGQEKKFRWNVSAARLHQQEANINNSELETFNGAARFDYEFNAQHEAKLILRGADMKKGFYESNASGYGDLVELPDPNDTISNQDWLAGFEYRGRPVPIWETVVRLGHYGTDFRSTSILPNVDSTVIAPPFNGNFPGRTFAQERRDTFEWQNHVTAFENDDIRDIVTAGAYVESEHFNQDDTKFFNNVRFHHVNYAGFLQNRLELFDRAFLTCGVRREENEEFGSFTTARGDASILIPESDTRIYGSAGTGFRSPGFQELFAPFFGNPDLQPEENFAYDVGIEQHFWDRRIRLNATWFNNDFESLIGFDFVTSTLNNIGTANTRGFEFQAHIRPIKQVTIEGTATLMSTRNDNGTRLLRRPPRTYTGRLVVHPLVDLVPQRYDGLDISLEFLHVGTRSDLGPTADNSFATVRADGYTRGDIAVSYRFLEHFRAFVRIENFTDEKYEEVKTFSANGSNTLGGLEFNWRF
ncbi:MAG: TonB-dependent receptor [Planctomycetes bacterium]|nr:TonB-dependent receptor [Planctomycetota bacterium]